MDVEEHGGSTGRVEPALQWHATGWDGAVALAGVVVLMLGAPLAIMAGLGCVIVLLAMRHRR